MQQPKFEFSVLRAVDGVAVVVMIAAMTLACAVPLAQSAFGATASKAACRDPMSAYLDAHRAAAFSLDDARRMDGTGGHYRPAAWSAVCQGARR
jgi:hypothetical protein